MANERNARLVYSTGTGRVTAPRAEPAATPASSPTGKGGVRLRLDRRASGRVVTLVTGVPGGPAALQALGRELRAACGTGGTVRDDTIELQGDHRERVEAELAQRGLRSKRAGG
jgi:translation initiation factor 1